MSAVVLRFPDRRAQIAQDAATEFEPNYFGNCPKCRRAPWVLNVYKDNNAVCLKCGVCWWIGYNILSSWQSETDAEWKRNNATLATLRLVEPLILPEARNRPREPGEIWLPPEFNSYEAYARYRDNHGGDEPDGAA